MMPYCDWKRCKRVAVKMIDLKTDDREPWVCDKHLIKLIKLLNQGCEE